MSFSRRRHPMKKSIYFACISLLVGSLAVAQTTQRPTMPKSATPSATSADMTSTDAFRASKLIGTNVKNNDGDTIGEVDDLIISSGNQMLQAVLSVGGFLGIGERHVTVPFKELRRPRPNSKACRSFHTMRARRWLRPFAPASSSA